VRFFRCRECNAVVEGQLAWAIGDRCPTCLQLLAGAALAREDVETPPAAWHAGRTTYPPRDR
jgi:hypothetical protein